MFNLLIKFTIKSKHLFNKFQVNMMKLRNFSSNNTYIFALKLGLLAIGMTIGTKIAHANAQINTSKNNSTDMEMNFIIPHQATLWNSIQ